MAYRGARNGASARIANRTMEMNDRWKGVLRTREADHPALQCAADGGEVGADAEDRDACEVDTQPQGRHRERESLLRSLVRR